MARKYAKITPSVLRNFDIATKILIIISSYFIINFLLDKKSHKSSIETKMTLVLTLIGFICYFAGAYFYAHILYMFTLFSIILLGDDMPALFKKLTIYAIVLHVYCTSVYNFCFLSYFQTKSANIVMVKSEFFHFFMLFFILGQYALWLTNSKPNKMLQQINMKLFYIITGLLIYETIAYNVPKIPFIVLNETFKKY